MGRTSLLLDAVPPAAGAAVMGTGIVSIGLARVGRTGLSDALLAIDVGLWASLCLVFGLRLLWQHHRWRAEARSPGALTGVAGTAVLGARLALLGDHWALYVLAAFAAFLWLALVAPVLRHWETPTVGASFMVVVATESLALLAALVALQQRAAWLAVLAIVPFVLGLVAYVFVLSGFDLRELVVGRGDHWIAGGALAIATLACARTAEAVDVSPSLSGLAHVLDDTSFVLWLVAAAWLPALIAAEVASPRLGYDLRRWSAVFPLGMYAVSSIAVAGVTGHGWLRTFGHAWVWVAFAVWAIVFAATLLRGARVVRDVHRVQAAP